MSDECVRESVWSIGVIGEGAKDVGGKCDRTDHVGVCRKLDTSLHPSQYLGSSFTAFAARLLDC